MSPKKRFTDDSYRREPWFKALCKGLLSCRSEEDVSNLLRDLGTLGELQDWSERLEVARLLVTGMSYRNVAAKTGVSTTTVTRVAKAIENGTGGYRKLLHASRHHRIVPAQPLPQSRSSDLQASTTDPVFRPASRTKEDKPRPVSVLQKYLARH